jgi:hypothetical protein
MRGILPFLESTRQRQNDLRNQTHRELMYRPLQVQKRSQYFFGSDDEALPVAMCVHNPDRSPFAIYSCDPT